ncbi:MAG: hypothetical protein WB762_31475 [Candidatus Sulfotelmatobacter sp.]
MAAYEAPFVKESVVVDMETLTVPAIALRAWKFLSLKMTVGVAS